MLKNGGVIVKKCTQCGQILTDETKFCFKCGGANFEPAAESGSYQQPAQQPPAQQPSYQQAYQQQTYQQPPVQQPYRQAPAGGEETVSVGMNLLFLVLMSIPLVNLIYAIVIAASSNKRSYKNLGIAGLIWIGISIVLGIIFSALIWGAVVNFIDTFRDGFNYSYTY